MKNRNICKFIESSEKERLVPRAFVCERNASVMRSVQRLTLNRILLVTKGGGTAFVGGRDYECGMGDILFCFLGESIHFEPVPDTEYLYITFEGSRCGELFRRFGISENSRLFASHEGLIPFWRDALSRAAEANIDIISESVLLYSLSYLTEREKQTDGVSETVLTIIEEEFSDSELSLGGIAARLGYNSKYLSHTFKEKIGMGVAEYIRTVRIRHAVFLLEHGIDSVKNIATLCGFSDPLYFSTVFKKTVGMSPNMYIKRENGSSLSED